jgi:hypothetical protein
LNITGAAAHLSWKATLQLSYCGVTVKAIKMSSGNNESDNLIVKRDERWESDYFQTDKEGLCRQKLRELDLKRPAHPLHCLWLQQFPQTATRFSHRYLSGFSSGRRVGLI